MIGGQSSKRLTVDGPARTQVESIEKETEGTEVMGRIHDLKFKKF